MQLGFIGLGHLGKAIAERLLACDHSLYVWNRTLSKATAMKAEIGDSPAAVAKETEIIFLCLFDSGAVRSVLCDPHGLLSGDIAGKIIVDLSTNHFKDVINFHSLCSGRGAIYMESPVLGSVVPAANGALTVLVSGSKKGYEKINPVLNDIGNHIFYLGKPSLATKMKLINNLTLGSFMATIAEAMAMGEDIGLAKKEIIDILSAGGGNSLVLNAKKGKLLEEDFSTHFSNALLYKDIHCLQDLAYELHKPLVTGAITKELYARTFDEGIASKDFSAIYKLFKKK